MKFKLLLALLLLAMFIPSAMPATTYQINFKEGNNFFCIPLENTGYNKVNDIRADLPSVTWIYIWDATKQNWDIVNANVTPSLGMLAQVPSNYTLTVSGDVPEEVTTMLYGGWNLVGYAGKESVMASELYETIPDCEKISLAVAPQVASINELMPSRVSLLAYPNDDFVIEFGNVIWIYRNESAEPYVWKYTNKEEVKVDATDLVLPSLIALLVVVVVYAKVKYK